ncbi:hypothetical protein [Actinoalloteichus caeruleus]|uniref:hypothetical protein n=1 Tax=Actinoalloteichus cyanogriseus TaxID=2893586 RepID=UPI0004ABC4C8|nr:hypothetical protein [Actinoalloteichus caeruleus]
MWIENPDFGVLHRLRDRTTTRVAVWCGRVFDAGEVRGVPHGTGGKPCVTCWERELLTWMNRRGPGEAPSPEG